MNCRLCSYPMPDGQLGSVCADCLKRESHKAYLELQKPYLAGILAGEHPLTLTLTSEQALPHVVLYGDRQHAWCGATVGRRKTDRHVRYPEQRLANVCRLCKEQFERLVEEIPREVA